MDRKSAKELIHIQAWLERVDEITQRGKETSLADALLQEAGDSLMMKLGEGAANRLSRLGVLAPEEVEWALAVANRNPHHHQYDEINRELTLTHALARSPGLEVIPATTVRGSLDHDPRRLRLTTTARSARTRRHAAT